MPSVAKIRCDQCGRRTEKAALILEGRALCQSCADRVPFLPCQGCGRNTRKRDAQGRPFCRSCRIKGRTCARCEKPLPKASLIGDDGAVCWPCARKFYREPQACELCGQMDLSLNGVDTPEGRLRVCTRCWRKNRGYASCAVCRKHRVPVGQLPDGRPVCKRCMEAGDQPFVCPKCGQAGRMFSKTRCVDCYERDRLRQKVSLSAILLRQGWTRDAWQAFGEDLAARMMPHNALHRIERYFLLFARLDAEFSRTAEITPAALLNAVGGREGLRRFAVPYGFLVKSRVVPDMTRALLDDTAEQLRQEEMLQAVEGTWFAPAVQRFHAQLLALHTRYRERGWTGRQSRMRLRTVTQNLRAAIAFCQAVQTQGVTMLQQIAPHHLDAFIAQHNGSKESIRAFVRHLNRREKLFAKLKVSTAGSHLPEGIFLSRDRYLELLRAWLSPSDESVREALMGLLMLLYAQPVARVVALRLSDLVEGRGGQYRIALAKTEITLDPNVSAVLRRWLDQRRALMLFDNEDANPYLFPGRRFGEHLTTSAVTYWLRKAGVNAEQLYSSAIYNAYRNGARLPKVLMNAFGLTKTTAIKYLNLIDPRLVDEVQAA